VKGAIQRLTDFPAVPECAAHTDPEVHAVRRRLKETLHELQDRGYDRMSRKHMHYSSHGWGQRKTVPEA